ncbi:MAG: sulfotransferase family protein [Sphingomonadaceae bacterium]
MADFFVIGSAKAGTTILYEWLRCQSDIFLPAIKEPHYYCFAGLDPQKIGRGVDPVYASQIAYNRHSYEDLYRTASPRQLKGDVSPGYLYYSHSAEAIFTKNPLAKIICILRDPAERAFSQFMHHRRDGRESHTCFESALAAENSRIANNWWWGYHYSRASRYAAALEQYFIHFPRRNILVLRYDDLEKFPQITFRKILDFLGCVEDQPINFQDRTNEASKLQSLPRFAWLHRHIETGGPVHAVARAIMPQKLSDRLRSGVLAINQRAASGLDPAIRTQLIAQHRSDIEKTALLTGLDLGEWLPDQAASSRESSP